MNVSLPNPSSRLVRAASAEHAETLRCRDRLVGERERLIAEMRQLDDALAAADERLGVLAQLIGPGQSGDPAVEGVSRAIPRFPEAPPATGEALRGPRIREVAVRVVTSQPEHIEALHYRRWYELVTEAGYVVVGKDPLAVFLTQLSRSPVVHKAAQRGVYELDRKAPLRIRRHLEQLRAELRDVATASPEPIELASVRARRHELDLAISRLERALEEALHSLRRDDVQADPIGATSAPRLRPAGGSRTDADELLVDELVGAVAAELATEAGPLDPAEG